MTWQLFSLLLVALALAGGLWWYERTRPPAKVVAVIATLAALAALGRDAFAALPDVKPTTAIVLVAGYAFGAPSGFAVGAIAALASNLELGQGPWTPWQMLAWGLVGVGGALLGRATNRRLGRFGLACACALAAVGFEAIIDLYTLTGTGALSLAGYWVVVAQAFTFSATHVIASFAFGLAFGPALVRMLLRVRARLEVRWQPAGIVPLLALAATGASAALAIGAGGGIGGVAVARAAAPAPATSAAATAAEVAYLRAAQNADGGFGGAPGQASTELYTAWAAMGLAAAGVDPRDVRRDGHSVVDALRADAAQLSGVADDERTILALHASDAPIGSFPGGDLVAAVLAARFADGSIGGQVNTTAFGIFALRAAGTGARARVVAAAGRWLAAQQNADGGFSFARRGSASDSDDTAAALQGLADSLGRGSPPVGRAVRYLRATQNADGGWSLDAGAPSDAQSTAWAIQALDAAGIDPGAVRPPGGRSPVGYLLTLVGPSGSVNYSRTSSQTPVWVTSQALTALAGTPFPVPPPVARRAPDVASRTGSPRSGGPRSASAQRPASTPPSAAALAPAAALVRARGDALARDAGLLTGALLGLVLD